MTQTLRLAMQFQQGTINFGGVHTWWYYGNTSPPTVSILGAWATIVRQAWTTNLAPMTSTAISLVSCTAQDMSSTSAAIGVDTTAVPGTRAGIELPMNSCVLINHSIGRRYRGGKPRTYLPAGQDGDTTDGRHWTSTFLTAMGPAWSAFIGALAGNKGGLTNVAQLNVSRYHGFTPVQNPITGRWKNVPKVRVDVNGKFAPVVDQVIGATINPVIGNQRRRLRSGS